MTCHTATRWVHSPMTGAWSEVTVCMTAVVVSPSGMVNAHLLTAFRYPMVKELL